MSQTLKQSIDDALHDKFEQLNPEIVKLCKRAMARNLPQAQARQYVHRALVDAGAALGAIPQTLNAMDSWLTVEYTRKGK